MRTISLLSGPAAAFAFIGWKEMTVYAVNHEGFEDPFLERTPSIST
jgi:hypothetical protein